MDGVIREIVTIDNYGDIWISCGKDSDLATILGSVLINSCGDENIVPCFTIENLEFIKEDLYYTYISSRINDFLKLKLTKLAKKMYSIPEEFNGALYINKRRLNWRN
jgi:hypothetical protein